MIHGIILQVQRSTELIGYFVEPDVWWKLVQANIKSTQYYTSLMILAYIMKGTERRKLKPYLSDICCTLANPDICLTVQVTFCLNFQEFSMHQKTNSDITRMSTQAGQTGTYSRCSKSYRPHTFEASQDLLHLFGDTR